MSQQVKGDLLVKRTITTERRVNEGAYAETITAQRDLILHEYAWLRISNDTTQDVVLPDATTLPLGWKQVIDVPVTSVASVNVKTYHISSPVLLKNILTDRAYEFICVDNSTAAGTWLIDFLEEADKIPTGRYSSPFTATTEWGTASNGYYTITITEATHGRGTNPNVQVYELSGSDFHKVDVDDVLVLANGNTSIRVPEVPNLRFAGKIVFI